LLSPRLDDPGSTLIQVFGTHLHLICLTFITRDNVQLQTDKCYCLHLQVAYWP